MQIVIDIPEQEYNHIKQANAYYLIRYERMIKSGIPLPKGHGRLIDRDLLADRLEELRDDWNYYGNDYENGMYKGYDCSLDEVIKAPTIIEADKENV